jgi:hypothetical protein
VRQLGGSLVARIAALGSLLTPLMLATSAQADPIADASNGPNVAQLDSEPQPEPLPVRVALSETATKRLFALRVRRLLSIELEGVANVSMTPTGPLRGDIIRIWIDTPTPRRAFIEVRRGSRSVAQRALAIADFPADVAARVVTIATAEMVRVQARLGEPSDPGPIDDGTEGRADEPGVAARASFGTVFLPSADPAIMVGPAFTLEHRTSFTTQALHVRVLGGEGDLQRLRWLEIGGTLGMRWRLGDRWRLAVGASASGLSLDLPKAAVIDGAAVRGAEWSARATGVIGGELAVAPDTWLSLELQPGGLVRSLDVVDGAGRASSVGGFAMGLELGLVIAPD